MASRRRSGGVDLDVRSNIRSVMRDLPEATKELVDQAASIAINEAMNVSIHTSVGQASKERKVAPKYIEQRFARERAHPGRLLAVASFNPRGLNPYKLGMSAEAAMAYYGGQAVSPAFKMTMPNGSTHWVVRLPKSRVSFPKYIRRRRPKNDPAALAAWNRHRMNGYFDRTKGKTVHRRNRLPVAAIKIFIGRDTIKAMDAAIQTIGLDAFEDTFYRLLQQGWRIQDVRHEMRRISAL